MGLLELHRLRQCRLRRHLHDGHLEPQMAKLLQENQTGPTTFWEMYYSLITQQCMAPRSNKNETNHFAWYHASLYAGLKSDFDPTRLNAAQQFSAPQKHTRLFCSPKLCRHCGYKYDFFWSKGVEMLLRFCGFYIAAGVCGWQTFLFHALWECKQFHLSTEAILFTCESTWPVFPTAACNEWRGQEPPYIAWNLKHSSPSLQAILLNASCLSLAPASPSGKDPWVRINTTTRNIKVRMNFTCVTSKEISKWCWKKWNMSVNHLSPLICWMFLKVRTIGSTLGGIDSEPRWGWSRMKTKIPKSAAGFSFVCRLLYDIFAQGTHQTAILLANGSSVSPSPANLGRFVVDWKIWKIRVVTLSQTHTYV